MTDKQLLDTLTNVKQTCGKHFDNHCEGCPFHLPQFGKQYCQLRSLAQALFSAPIGWDLHNVKSIVKED